MKFEDWLSDLDDDLLSLIGTQLCDLELEDGILEEFHARGMNTEKAAYLIVGEINFEDGDV